MHQITSKKFNPTYLELLYIRIKHLKKKVKMELARLKLIFLFSFIILIPCLSAIAEADEVWRRRAEEAMQTTEQYYDPDPVAVASNLNMKVQEYVNNNTNTKNSYL